MKMITKKRAAIMLLAAQSLMVNQSGAVTFKINGDLMIDHDTFDSGLMEANKEQETSDELQSLTEIRRAQISLKTRFNDDWQAKIKVDFADSEIDIKDAYIQYKGIDWANVTIGQHKEGFGLEKRSSSSGSALIERSLMSNALAPSRALGMSLSGSTDLYNWQIGYYQPEDGAQKAVTGRAAWLPWQHKNELLHLGVSFSERQHTGNEYRINESLEVHTADSLFESQKRLAEHESLQGIEFLWQKNGLSAMAEWQQSSLTDINQAAFDYEGGYVQLSYHLSGEGRQYKNGKLGSVEAKGWEFAARVSQFELLTENEEAQIYTAGVNYTFNKNTKLMANLIHAKQWLADEQKQSSNGVSLRLQYAF